MTVANDAVLRCSARWGLPTAAEMINVWWFQTAFAEPQDELVVFNAVDAYLTSVFVEFDEKMRSSVDPIDLKVDVVAWQNGRWETVQNVGFGPWGAGIATVSGGDMLPQGVAILGYLYTTLGKHQGRKYLGGFTESDSDVSGNPLPASLSLVAAGLAKLLTNYIISVGNVLETVVADHTTGIARLIWEVGVSGAFAYQRRRRPGAGA